MNLCRAFLWEIFAIFHRRYLPFFRYFQKIFVKKICLERKRKNGIFSLSPHKKIFILLLLLTITLKYELKYVVLSPKSVAFANLIIYPSLPLRTRRIVDGFRLGTLGCPLACHRTSITVLLGCQPCEKTLIDCFFLVAIPFSLVKSVFFEKAMLAAA